MLFTNEYPVLVLVLVRDNDQEAKWSIILSKLYFVIR